MNAQQRLSQVLVDWDRAADDYSERNHAAAIADSAWARFRAVRRIELKAEAVRTGSKLTVPDLDAQIIVDDVDGLMEAAAIADALVAGLRKRLDVLAAQVDACRTEIASERQRERAWGASPSVPTVADVGGFG